MIGKMDKRIEFYSEVATDDNMGGNRVTPFLQQTRWANIVEKGKGNAYTDNTVLHARNIKITIRLDETISENWFITWNNRNWTIDSIYNDEKYTYLNCYE